MAEIRRYPFVRHFRAEPSAHVIFWKRGSKRRAGPGLAFWFAPLGASLAEVPLDDRELAFVVRGRSSDFQEVVVNGAVTWRVVDPELLAGRVDFSLDPTTGRHNKEPLERLAQVLAGPTHNLAIASVARAPLRQLLDEGVEPIRRAIHDGLARDEALTAMGLEIVATSVGSVAPAPEIEKALQMPARERIQQSADQATFERRALAVEKERAIQENELANQIELARREEQLIAQRGQNERRRATEAAESKRIEATGEAEGARLRSAAEADGWRLIEAARVEGERARLETYRELPGADGLVAALQRLVGAAATRLERA